MKNKSKSDLQTLEPVQFPLPDIYYIILDGYGSEKELKDVYGFDNSDFERNLESMGFYVNRQAHSNYKQTNLSITSSLNFKYLQDVGPELNRPNGGISTLGTMFENNLFFGQLKQQGYQVVAFSNGYEQTDLKKTADIYLSGANSPSAYETGLINTTPMSLLLWRDAYDWHRGKVIYTLSELPETVYLKSPKIVFAHILIPHPPFVLSSEGKAIYPNRPFNIYDGSDFMGVGSPQEYIGGYRQQVEYINKSISAIIRQILDQAKTPPIIILQGDHGPGLRLDHNDVTKTDVNERFSILSAYYFPDEDYSTVYEGMTPVNTFRVILNKYFQTNYEILSDKSYFSEFYHPFTFIDVTNQFHP